MQILFLFAIFVSVFGDLYLRRNEDSEVAICDTFDVCNIVHHQFWGSDSVEKLCKCPDGSFCPGTFDANDSSSLPVNIRTQMKFCSTISQLEDQLKECENDEDVIKVRTIYHVDQLKNVSASLMCNCWKEKPVYWRFHSRHGRAIEEDEKLFEYVDNFRCSELSKCNENEFCGFTRLDFGFLFQRCTCDTVHDCQFEAESSEVEEDIESELFYSGLMYKSKCVRNDKFDDW